MNDTRTQIGDAFLELTKEKQPEKIKVIDICKKAFVSRETFYYHFKDKYDLFEWIYKDNLIKRIQTHSAEKSWTKMIENVIIDALEYKEVLYKLIGNENLEYCDIIFDTLYSIYCKEFSKCISSDKLTEEIESKIYIYLKGGIDYYQYYLSKHEDIPYKKVAKLIADASPNVLIDLWFGAKSI